MKCKKAFGTIILGAILLSMISCGDQDTQTPTSDTAPVTDAVTTAETEAAYVFPEVDMNGWEMSIYNFDETWLTWANTRIVVDGEDGDILNDALYRRNTFLEETYNCKIVVEEVENTGWYAENLIMSGDDTYDIIVRTEGESVASYLPMSIDWHEIPHLQLDQPWWNPNATSVYEIGGIQAALAGNMSLSAVSRAVCPYGGERGGHFHRKASGGGVLRDP